MVPALIRSPSIVPKQMNSAKKPFPVPNVRQSHEPSALQPSAMRKPWEHSCMAMPSPVVERPSASRGTEPKIRPRSKLVWT